MIAFAVQLREGVGAQAFTTLALGISPLIIFVVTVVKNNRKIRFTPSDIVCGTLAGIGIALWLLTDNPGLALVCSILGDFFSAIPTLIKSFKQPETEHAAPYFLSFISMVLTICTIREWNIVHYGFTLYILVINLVFVVMIWGDLGAGWRAKQKKRSNSVKRRALRSRAKRLPVATN
jgi:hypothetical protein